MLEVLSERRPVIGVVTSSLVQGPTAGTRSVWEKHRLYGEGDISSFPSSVTDSERIEVLCLYFQMLHLQPVFMHVMNSHSDASLCITMEKGEKQRRGG